MLILNASNGENEQAAVGGVEKAELASVKSSLMWLTEVSSGGTGVGGPAGPDVDIPALSGEKYSDSLS